MIWVWYDMVRYAGHMICSAMICYALLRYDMICYAVTFHDMIRGDMFHVIWSDVVWSDTRWHDIVWYRMIWCIHSCICCFFICLFRCVYIVGLGVRGLDHWTLAVDCVFALIESRALGGTRCPESPFLELWITLTVLRFKVEDEGSYSNARNPKPTPGILSPKP